MQDFDCLAVVSSSPPTKQTASHSESEEMSMAIACLGGQKRWKGLVRGFFGLLRQEIDIKSSGAVEDGVLIFRETLTFKNGSQKKREWCLQDMPGGLMLKATDAQQLRPAKIEDDLLTFNYLLKLNGIKVDYQDAFELNSSGRVSNTGKGNIFGLPVLTVEVAETTN